MPCPEGGSLLDGRQGGGFRLRGGQREEARGKRPEERGKRPEEGGKREEERGKRKEGRGKREEERGKRKEGRGQRKEAGDEPISPTGWPARRIFSSALFPLPSVLCPFLFSFRVCMSSSLFPLSFSLFLPCLYVLQSALSAIHE
jgi:hypothetical protein